MKHTLHIQDYEVWVNLGCSAVEQSYTQPVHASVGIYFQSSVLGATTDELTDAVDYVAITEIIKSTSESKAFHLIEHLNQQIFSEILNYLKLKNISGRIQLSTKKIRVPVQSLTNGVVFVCEAEI